MEPANQENKNTVKSGKNFPNLQQAREEPVISVSTSKVFVPQESEGQRNQHTSENKISR